MKYYLGIEGGGTKTIAILGSDKEILGMILVGATNYHSTGKEEVSKEIGKIISWLKIEKNIDVNEIQGICFGGAGIDCKADDEVMEKLFCSMNYKGKLHICNDSVVALVGANGCHKGAMLISGTGSVAYGISRKGEPTRVGGWGHLIDDEGSGYAIARDGLKKIMESYDGRGQETLLWDRIKKKLNIARHEELIQFIYAHDTQKQHIAALAPCVIELSGKDYVADNILKESINGLCKMVIALSERMELMKFSLGLNGSLLLKSEVYRKLFTERIAELLPEVYVHLPYKDAAYGALVLARDLVLLK